MFDNFKSKFRSRTRTPQQSSLASVPNDPAASTSTTGYANDPSQCPEPLAQNVGLRVAHNGIGLSLIGESKSGPEDHHEPVDIIAVHGLNGSAHGTWTNHVNGKIWLKDVLPDYVPGSRVYTFGYASKVRSNPSLASLPDFARALLDAIRNIRDQPKETFRSTIFVCHSLGGLVCKQALVFAHLDHERYGSLLQSTIGVLFLGTPHRGSNLADMATIVGRIINLATAPATIGASSSVIRRDLLSVLSYDSESLQELDFSARNLWDKITVASFYETLPTPPLSIPVVTRQSAVLGISGEDIVPLNLNHRNMSRLSPETPECLSVCQAIRRMHHAGPKHPIQAADASSRSSSSSGLSNLERTCMRLFSVFDLREYKNRLPEPIHGTCAWIASHPIFVSWIEQATNALLWLTGHPGCGKTVLSYSVAKRLERDGEHVLVYFCDNKVTAQQDAKAILTGLIFQLIHRNRRLIRHIRREFEFSGTSIIQSFSILWSVFKSMIKDLKGTSIYVVIDALDECETSSRHYLTSAIKDLIDNPSRDDSSKNVKFFFTSRPMLDLAEGFRGAMRHLLPIDDAESGYVDDLQQFIHQRVDEIALKHRCSDHTKSHLLETLLSRADRTFLWIHMVLSSLEESFLSSVSDLDIIISTLPPSLESTYSSFLAKIPKSNQAIAHRLLSLMLASSRPLHLDEMNCAFAIDGSHQSSIEVLQSCQTALDRTIQGILGPLVRISSQKASLVHQTVKDFLLVSDAEAGQLQSYEACPGMPIITTKSAALYMATACVRYLLLDDFSSGFSSLETSPVNSNFSDSEGATKVHDMWGDQGFELDLFAEPDELEATVSAAIASQHAFYSYAALHWPQHYSTCESIAPPELRNSVMSLINSHNAAGQTWLSYLRSEAIDADAEYPKQLNGLILSARFNFIGAAAGVLQTGDCAQRGTDEALFWSAKYSNHGIVKLLLDASADPNYQGAENQTALMASAAAGHLTCVQHLLADRRCEVNARGKGGRSALSFAAGNGHYGTARYLLEVEAVEADEPDHAGTTPFMWAAGGGHLAILSILAKDPRIDVNKRDKNGRTALSWAAGDGMDEVVFYLLKQIRGVDPNLPDKTGRTPLSWAAGNGHKGVIDVLFPSRRVDKYKADDGGRTPISWASGHGHEDALRTLLGGGTRGLEDEDIDGWTPLAWAVQRDAPGVVEALIDAGVGDLDKGPRTVLSWAMEYGHLSVVRVLLAKGADPETARDRMAFAQSMGRHDLVNELSYSLNNGQTLG
ncbi:hypothetical protein QQX98_009220 [Neonectria punicea]|uniref:NACHT domain-containing protein n=1 Tax=Neonectria punicea TaxID=979145 RepID=A0ABR1GSX7_9HYPO